MPALVSRSKPRSGGPLSQAGTTFEPSEAIEPLTAALTRYERMLAPRTYERVPNIVNATLVGVGALGTWFAFNAVLGTTVGYPYLIALPALYPLTTPTIASVTAEGPKTDAVMLASAALAPLVTPTPPAGLYAFALAPMPAPRATGPSSPSRAYRVFTQLADWLGMTQEETARLLGVGRTTPLAWRRGHEPRPSRARRLYQTHALVKTLVRRLGTERARRWLARGTPSPMELITAGDVDAADDRAEELIFGPRAHRAPIDAWVDEPASDSELRPSDDSPPRRVARSAPRRRLR